MNGLMYGIVLVNVPETPTLVVHEKCWFILHSN